MGIGLVASIDAIWGPIWPTEPEIKAHDNINASSFILPFIINNQSVLFAQNNITVSCGIYLAYFVDETDYPILIRGVLLDPPPISIGRASTNNYACSANQYIRLNDYGYLEIGFEHNVRMYNNEKVLHKPLSLLKMCVWISGFYNVFGFKLPFHSPIFQWPVMPGQNQWIEGPLPPDLPNQKWKFGERYPLGALQCGPT